MAPIMAAMPSANIQGPSTPMKTHASSVVRAEFAEKNIMPYATIINRTIVQIHVQTALVFLSGIGLSPNEFPHGPEPRCEVLDSPALDQHDNNGGDGEEGTVRHLVLLAPNKHREGVYQAEKRSNHKC